MPRELPPHIWFVRSNGGAGSYPVTAQGWRAVKVFVAGVAVSAVAAIVLAMIGPMWLWPIAFVAGMAYSAWDFIATARRHTDYTITYSDYLKDKTDA